MKTIDEIYELCKTEEKLTWAEIIKILYDNLYEEGYRKGFEDGMNANVDDGK